MLNTPHRLTPSELARLRGIASRVRIGSLRNDALPFVRVSYEDAPNERTDTVIPWREAMEIEDEMITCDHRAGVLDAPCGAPATHRVARSTRAGADGWYMCDEHTAETRRRFPRWQYRKVHP